MSKPDGFIAQLDVRLREMQGKPQTWLIVAGIALLFAIAIGFTLTLEQFRHSAIDAGGKALKSSSLVLARHFDREFEDFTVLQKDTVALLERLSDPSRSFTSQFATHDVHDMLRGKSSEWSDIAGVNIFDANGVMVNSSQQWPIPNLRIDNRAYFIRLKNDPNRREDIGVVSGIFGQVKVMVFARKVVSRSGEFLGVVTRAMVVSRIKSFLESAAFEHDMTISLYHRNGQLLVRFPSSDDVIDETVASGSVLGMAIADAPSVLVLDEASGDEPRVIVASTPMTMKPLVVVTTQSLDTTLATWRSQTKFFLVVAISSVAIIILTLYFIFQQFTQQLNVDKKRLDTAINTMSQGLLMFDQNERLIVCNRRYIDMYGLSTDAIKPGISLRDLLQHRHERGSLFAEVESYYHHIRTMRHLSERFLKEMPGGRLIEICNEPVAAGGWVATHEDVTQRVRAEERIAHLAHFDGLTDLPNRLLMRNHLEQRLAELDDSRPFALLYIDLDGFKSVNDTLGHEVGDELLRHVATRLRGCVGPGDMVARQAGDEFAIVTAEIHDLAGLAALAEQILAVLRIPVICGDKEISTDASIGIAIAPEHGRCLEELLRRADLAMYAAKSEGRRTFRVFVPELDSKARLRQQIEIDLRHALANNEFELHYQPLVDLATNGVTGCEALLRWRHPQRGMISPADFIPIAEHTGLIVEIGEWVLRQSCLEAAKWPAHVRVAINVSPVQFSSNALALKVATALAESGLSPNRLELEITETVLIGDDEQALAILDQLRELGVRIALDDFGTGFSSLSYLHRFAFDKIKIDRSFIKDIGESKDSLPIVRAVVQMASARKMTTTAEGVETDHQRDALRALGCDQMQGYLFSPALPASELYRLFWKPPHREIVAGV